MMSQLQKNGEKAEQEVFYKPSQNEEYKIKEFKKESFGLEK